MLSNKLYMVEKAFYIRLTNYSLNTYGYLTLGRDLGPSRWYGRSNGDIDQGYSLDTCMALFQLDQVQYNFLYLPSKISGGGGYCYM